jgi:hypothetical protein
MITPRNGIYKLPSNQEQHIRSQRAGIPVISLFNKPREYIRFSEI